jgi:hypothetical protein
VNDDERECWDHASTHDAVDPHLYWTGYGTARRWVILCRGCLAGLSAIGMDWHPEQRAEPGRRDRGVAHGPLLDRLVA